MHRDDFQFKITDFYMEQQGHMPFSTRTTGHYSSHTALSTISTAHPAIRLPPSERAAMVTRMRALSSGLQRLLDAFLGTHTCTSRSYEHVFICICMILYACINNILILCFINAIGCFFLRNTSGMVETLG